MDQEKITKLLNHSNKIIAEIKKDTQNGLEHSVYKKLKILKQVNVALFQEISTN